MESDSVIYGLLGRIHLLMRRVSNRITDVEYMRVNKDYAPRWCAWPWPPATPNWPRLSARLRLAMELDAPAPEADLATERGGPGLLERLRTARPEATHPTQRCVGSLR
ncbi:hypothetical protein [Zoogloea sp.]|uniref:hypothetical protein n=1 Tax=Zoogloea sp. TaxID=49181 RepID=UPI001DDD7F28|nr:hypothetical protein [Zoogloea sp.]MBK6655974.1 hypothetical protein [Zoogloea sp.]